VAILDWTEEIAEFPEPYELVRGRLMADGIPTVLTDERFLEFDGDKLSAKGQPVDVVFRGIVLDDVWRARRGGLRALEQAYEANRVGLLSNFRTVLFDHKRILSLLSDEAYRSRFSSREQRFIDRTVPWTRHVAERQTTRGDRGVDLIPHLHDNRDELVLKPGGGSGALDVVVGRFHTQARWEGAISRALLEGDWIVQENVEPPEAVFPRYEPEGIAEERLNYLWGAYVVAERTSGFVIRAGTTYNGVIAAAKGAGVGCAFVCSGET
jgi:hypothetical protein